MDPPPPIPHPPDKTTWIRACINANLEILLFHHCWNSIIIIDSFHIVSAHAPNSLIQRYLREITREGANLYTAALHFTMEYGKRLNEK